MLRQSSIYQSPPAIELKHRTDGSVVLQSSFELLPYARCTTERLVYWAEHAPDRLFLAKRRLSSESNGEWQSITYAEMLDRVRRIAQALLDRGLSATRPLVILSGNDLEHALLALAAQHVGIPYAPISPAYSLISSDFGRLRHIVSLLSPGLIFASNGKTFGSAIAAAVPRETEVVCTHDPDRSHSSTLFPLLENRQATQAVDDAFHAVKADTIAKFLFTSGSTGQPKGVITTHRMLCSNQQMIIQALPCLGEEPPILVDWLPWHHTFGGSFCFGLTLAQGGSLYIDDGKPALGAIDETLRNLREIAPTVYFSVPKGYEVLLPFLRSEPQLRRNFFGRMQFLFYAAASLSLPIWNGLQELARETCGAQIPILSSLGSTETAPALTFLTWITEKSGNVGLPLPGVEVKLVPNGSKYEMLVRGPNITPGYWREPDKTQEVFDSEAYYRMGDAVRFTDPKMPEKGLEFDGRIAEDFKLSTGTWVNVGNLRSRIMQCGEDIIRDVVFAGHDRDYVSALIFPHMESCRRLCIHIKADASAGAVCANPAVRERFEELLSTLAAQSTGATTRIERALLLEEPASIDGNEITDKGSINQRAVLDRRGALVDELYEQPCSPRVLLPRLPSNHKL